jgi:hypothetical protein
MRGTVAPFGKRASAAGPLAPCRRTSGSTTIIARDAANPPSSSRKRFFMRGLNSDAPSARIDAVVHRLAQPPGARSRRCAPDPTLGAAAEAMAPQDFHAYPEGIGAVWLAVRKASRAR